MFPRFLLFLTITFETLWFIYMIEYRSIEILNSRKAYQRISKLMFASNEKSDFVETQGHIMIMQFVLEFF